MRKNKNKPETVDTSSEFIQPIFDIAAAYYGIRFNWYGIGNNSFDICPTDIKYVLLL